MAKVESGIEAEASSEVTSSVVVVVIVRSPFSSVVTEVVTNFSGKPCTCPISTLSTLSSSSKPVAGALRSHASEPATSSSVVVHISCVSSVWVVCDVPITRIAMSYCMRWAVWVVGRPSIAGPASCPRRMTSTLSISTTAPIVCCIAPKPQSA